MLCVPIALLYCLATLLAMSSLAVMGATSKGTAFSEDTFFLVSEPKCVVATDI